MAPLALMMAPLAAAQDRAPPVVVVGQRDAPAAREAESTQHFGAPIDPAMPPIDGAAQWFGPAAYPPAAIRVHAQG